MLHAGGLQLRRILTKFRDNPIPTHTYNLHTVSPTLGNSADVWKASVICPQVDISRHRATFPAGGRTSPRSLEFLILRIQRIEIR